MRVSGVGQQKWSQIVKFRHILMVYSPQREKKMANKPAPPKAPKAPAPKAATEAATVTPESVPTPAATEVTPAPEAATEANLVHVTRKGSKRVMQVTREHYERYASKLEIVDA